MPNAQPDIIEPIDRSEVENREKLVRSLLIKLANREYIPDYGDLTAQFTEIYEGGYRQMYSSLLPMIADINISNDCELDLLCENLELFREYLKTDHGQEKWLFGRILKLNDHVNLEVQRLRSQRKIVEDQINTFDNVQRELSSLKKGLRQSESTLKKTKEKLKNFQIEMVTILAIFAAIVIAFSGGLNFLGSTVSQTSSESIYNLVCISALCGFVLFNTVALLIVSIHYIVNNPGRIFWINFSDIRSISLLIIYAVCNAILVIVFFWSTGQIPS